MDNCDSTGRSLTLGVADRILEEWLSVRVQS